MKNIRLFQSQTMNYHFVTLLWTVFLTQVESDEGDGLSPMGTALNTTTLTDSLDEVFEDYFVWKLKTYPEWATSEHIRGYNNLVEDFSMEAIKNKVEKCREFYDRSRKLIPKDSDYKIYQKILEDEILPCINNFHLKSYLFPPVNIMENIAVLYPELITKTDLDSLRDYQDMLERLNKLPRQLDQILELLRMGLKEGVIFAKESLQGVDEKFEKLQVPVNESIFYSRFRDMSGSLGRHVVDRIQTSAYNLTENGILPKFRVLQEFLRYEYSPKLRQTPGISTIPNGEEFYRANLQFHLGSDISPQEIKQFGEDEINKLIEGCKIIISDLGYNMTFKEFANFIREDKSQHFTSGDEALETYREKFNTINKQLVNIFPSDVLTDEVLNIQVLPSTGFAVAQYEDGKFLVRLEPLGLLTKFEALTLTLHEANPGHHLQFTQQKNRQNFPRFIQRPFFDRYSEIPGRSTMPTAVVEGWGLYSEYLGLEMNLFEDPFDKFGYYSHNLLRACRLVVDTGIHAFGWSRDQAIQYLLDNTLVSRQAAEGEIDRYITIPGQATAYKIGERKIKQLRSKAEGTLGDDFDVKEFHRTVLRCAGGSLGVLSRCVESWIQSPGQGSGLELDYDFDQSETSTASGAVELTMKMFALVTTLIITIQ